MKGNIILLIFTFSTINNSWTKPIEKLKEFSKYQNVDYSIPVFTYQDSNSSDLIDFKYKYNLDSIAGNKGEVEQILNLMRWVHKRVKHDGYKSIPDIRTGEQLIQLCDSENRGIHCGGIASVMNETFLAMGFKTKSITCMPYEQNYTDCHTINIVYSDSLDKWIWIDAMYQVYITDDYDNLLSIQEVRERLIKNKPLIVSGEYHLDSYTATDYGSNHYLYEYMGANLFRFSTLLKSSAHEDYKNSILINLVPTDYYPDKYEKGEIVEAEGYKDIYIDNDKQYWKIPE